MKTLVPLGLFLSFCLAVPVFAAETIVMKTVLIEDENPYEAGRKSKLDELDDELKAIQSKFTDGPIFGCFCAGEIGPADPAVESTDTRCCGSGWYLMLAVLYH